MTNTARYTIGMNAEDYIDKRLAEESPNPDPEAHEFKRLCGLIVQGWDGALERKDWLLISWYARYRALIVRQ